MATRNAQIQSVAQMQRNIVRAQPSSTDDKNPFIGGAYQDLDASLVPANAVHSVKNYRVHPWGLVGRGGSERYGTATLPYGLDEGVFSFSKYGDVVTIISGRDASTDDIGRFVVHDSGRCDKIIEVISRSMFRVENTRVESDSSSGGIASSAFSQCTNEKTGLQVIHVGTKLYYTYANAMTSYVEICRKGNVSVQEIESKMVAYGEDLIMLFCGKDDSGGIFKIDPINKVYWKANSAIPTVLVADVEKTTTKTYGRRQTYSMGILKGKTVQDSQRYDSGVEIMHESGTCMADQSGKDYGTVFTERPIGDASTTRGVLTGATLTGSGYETLAGWIASSIFQFGFTVDGVTKNCVLDSTGSLSMDQLAEKMQLAIRDHFPNVTCKWMGTYFLYETNVENSTIGQISAGEGDVNVGAIIGPGTVDSDATYTEPCPPITLTVPIDEVSGEYDTHWNSYCLYSSLDVGDEGENPITRDQNNPELFIHNTDIPIAKALIASVSTSGGGTVTIPTISYGGIADIAGKFVRGDAGCRLKFRNGSSVVLTTYVSEKVFMCVSSSAIAQDACAIGSESSGSDDIRVMVVNVIGGSVRVLLGDTFTSDDVGKILFLSCNVEGVITSVTDATHCEIAGVNLTQYEIAACIGPTSRKWTDTTRDDVYEDQKNLRSKIALWTLQQRFFLPLPNCDRGDVGANMIWAAQAGKTNVHYSQAIVGKRHLGGYYYEAEQMEETDDNIRELSIVGGILTVKCRRKTYSIPVNQFDSIEYGNEGTAIIKCAGISVLDGAVGIRHFGGVCNIPGMDKQVVITGEPAIRILSESGYGENLATDRIQKVLDKMIPRYATKYDPENGFTFWGFITKNI